MTDQERFRYETFIRIRQFGVDNAVDFPAGTVGADQFDEIAAVIGEVEQFTGNQEASFGDARFAFVGKETARENLREEIYEISQTARSMKYQINGIAEKFKVPHNLTDATMLAVGRAFHEESEPYEADFKSYGLPVTFRAELQTAIDEFEESMNPTATAIDDQVAATAQIGDAIKRGMIARRILEGVVKNRYRNNVGKLAAWLSASHIEKAPKKPPTA